MMALPSRTTCFSILAVLFATGLRVAGVVGLSCITSLAALAAKTFLMAATGWLYATDAITLFTIKGCRATKISRRAHCLRQKNKKTVLSMLRNSRRSRERSHCPTRQSQYQNLFSRTDS